MIKVNDEKIDISTPTEDINLGEIIKWVIVVFVVLIIIGGSFGTVRAGQVGIKTRFSAVTGKVLNPGVYFKMPFIESVVKMDTQTQKEQATASAASKDLQTVSSQVALNYSIDPAKASSLYQTVGVDYKSRIIDPAIQEAVKASTSQFTAEELVTKREEVRNQIKTHLDEKFAGSGILVEGFSIIDFNFSPSFNQAIEAKVTAEQNALAAKNKLAQVQYEAQQAVEEAKGKAQALTVESAAINSNPQILQLRAIEKWNGELPQVTGGATPFINLK